MEFMSGYSIPTNIYFFFLNKRYSYYNLERWINHELAEYDDVLFYM